MPPVLQTHLHLILQKQRVCCAPSYLRIIADCGRDHLAPGHLAHTGEWLREEYVRINVEINVFIFSLMPQLFYLNV